VGFVTPEMGPLTGDELANLCCEVRRGGDKVTLDLLGSSRPVLLALSSPGIPPWLGIQMNISSVEV